MKVQVSEATPIQLNYLAAKCNGKTLHYFVDDWFKKDPWLAVNGEADQPLHSYTPTTDWGQGGPIIEREKIDLFTEKGTPESWVASVAQYQNGMRLVGWRLHQYGPTPLIAAMRCYVASHLGMEVEIPEELT